MTTPSSFAPLATAAVCDALMQLHLPVRTAGPDLTPVEPGTMVAGHARPVRHAGSTDLLLEAIDAASPGDVLVVDNQGRRDEACIGDLIAAEAQLAGLSAIVVWGLHRDHLELRRLGLPVFSYGTLPTGPAGIRPPPADALETASLGETAVTADDVLVADDDGAVVVASTHVATAFAAARRITETERRQAAALRDGHSLREQLGFAEYRARHAADPSYDFRRHLRERGGAIEA